MVSRKPQLEEENITETRKGISCAEYCSAKLVISQLIRIRIRNTLIIPGGNYFRYITPDIKTTYYTNTKNRNIYITIYMYIQDQMYNINVQKVQENDCLCFGQNYSEGGCLTLLGREAL